MKATHAMKWIGLVLGATWLLTACNKTEYVHVGSNWEGLQKLEPSEETFDVKVRTGGKYKLGDELKFTVTSEKSGRLWVVQVDPVDEVSQLFPNRRESDNSIEANEPLVLPGAEADYVIEASEPVGASMVAFIVTTGDTDLHSVLSDSQSDTMEKALVLVNQEPAWGIAKQVIKIEK